MFIRTFSRQVVLDFSTGKRIGVKRYDETWGAHNSSPKRTDSNFI